LILAGRASREVVKELTNRLPRTSGIQSTFFVYLSSFLLLAGLTDPAIESHDPKTATPVSYHAILV
jgi:hypothetical protein